MKWLIKQADTPSPIHMLFEIEGYPVVSDRFGTEAVYAEQAHVWLGLDGEVTGIMFSGQPVNIEGRRGPDPHIVRWSSPHLDLGGPAVQAMRAAASSAWSTHASAALARPVHERPETVARILGVLIREMSQAEVREALAEVNLPLSETTTMRALKALAERGVLESRTVQRGNGKPLLYRRAGTPAE